MSGPSAAFRITKYNGLESHLVADSAPSPGWSSEERIALEFTVYTLEPGKLISGCGIQVAP